MRPLVTDLLEVAGLLLLIAACSVWVWTLAPAAGLATGGAGLVSCSALLTWRGQR